MEEKLPDENRVRFHLTYDSPLTMNELPKILNAVDNLYGTAYNQVRKSHKELELEEKIFSPTVEKVSEGSIIVDLLLNVISSVAVELIKEKVINLFHNARERDKCKELNSQTVVVLKGSTINISDCNFNMYIPQTLVNKLSKNHWNIKDEECFALYVIVDYVALKDNVSTNDFVERLPDFLVDKYGYNSLKMKLQNTKTIFNELNIQNSLNVSPLSNYSNQFKNVVINELKKFGI